VEKGMTTSTIVWSALTIKLLLEKKHRFVPYVLLGNTSWMVLSIPGAASHAQSVGFNANPIKIIARHVARGSTKRTLGLRFVFHVFLVAINLSPTQQNVWIVRLDFSNLLTVGALTQQRRTRR
tara:strand:- start:17 stop:385 length:369 start_codon:yes stop_codon:yes gene_type:complete